MDQENKTTAPEEELMTEETAEAVTEEKSPEEKKTKKKKSKEAEALETCEAEKKELEDRYLRLMAEYENYRRRTQKERENIYPDAVANTLKELLKETELQALAALDAMREKEGAALKEDLLKKLEDLEAARCRIADRAPYVVFEYKEKLYSRIRELLDKEIRHEVDSARLEQEITIFSDKCCIDEELTRLGSHFVQFRQIMEQKGPVGRQLDFLTQELNRETNTIASKSNDLEITREALAMKNEIEKIREQIQNIE